MELGESTRLTAKGRFYYNALGALYCIVPDDRFTSRLSRRATIMSHSKRRTSEKEKEKERERERCRSKGVAHRPCETGARHADISESPDDSVGSPAGSWRPSGA